MSNPFMPTPAQVLYGQPFQRFDCPKILEAVLEMVREEIIRVVGNRSQDRNFDPGANQADAFRCEGLGMWAYSWGDDDQLYNFCHQKSGVTVSWYKYMGRGMSCSRPVDANGAAEILRDCLKILQDVDDGAPFTHGGIGEVPYFSLDQATSA